METTKKCNLAHYFKEGETACVCGESTRHDREEWESDFDKIFPKKCKVCKLEGVNTYGECFCSYSPSTHIWEKPENVKDFIKCQIQRAREEEYRFMLNILDGIDIADEQMGIVGGTKAIRHALQSRMAGNGLASDL